MPTLRERLQAKDEKGKLYAVIKTTYVESIPTNDGITPNRHVPDYKLNTGEDLTPLAKDEFQIVLTGVKIRLVGQ